MIPPEPMAASGAFRLGGLLLIIAAPCVLVLWALPLGSVLLGRGTSSRVRPGHWALIVSSVMGIAAGPMVLGSCTPDAYRGFVLGNEASVRASEDAEASARTEMSALADTGVSPEAIELLKARHERELEPYRATATKDAASVLRAQSLIVLTIASVVLGVGAMGVRPRSRHFSDHGWSFAAVIGFLLPGALAALLAQRMLGMDRLEAASVGCLIALGSALSGIPLRLCREDWAARRLSSTTLWLGCIGVLLLVVLDAPANGVLGWTGPAAPLLVPCGYALGRLIGHRLSLESGAARRLRRFARAAAYVPVMLACYLVLSRLDLTVLADSWKPAVFAGLLIAFAGDARLLGQWLGWRWRGEPDRPVLPTWIEHQSSGIGYTQILLLLAAMGSGLLNAHQHAAAIAGVLMCAISAELFAGRVRRMLDLWQRDRAEDRPR
ncbi:MAG: hypothetical protein AAGG07_08825 [Planctomycetota bacterium]